jgi:hypothetical protein
LDFIERIFHLSPDGGNGSVEFMLLLGVLAFSIPIILHKFSRLRRAVELLSVPFREQSTTAPSARQGPAVAVHCGFTSEQTHTVTWPRYDSAASSKDVNHDMARWQETG